MKWRSWIVFWALAGICAAQLRAQEQVCPVSDDRFKRSQVVFAKMAAVFRHPRCINCHGAENPLGKGTQHSGGTFEVVIDAGGEADVTKTFAPCQECHGAFPGWKIPTRDMDFTNLDDVGLCKLIKHNVVRGDDLINHLARDQGGLPFIGEAFKGTRGFNDTGRNMVDKDPDPIRGITRDGLIALGREWIDALGSGDGTIGDGDFRLGITDCGCEPMQYALRVRIHATLQVATFTFDLGTKGPDAALPVVPIRFADDGSISGEATGNTSMTNEGRAGPAFCAGGVGQLIRLIATGGWKTFQKGAEKIEVKLGLSEISGHGLETCAPFPIVGVARVNQNTKGLVPYSFNFSLDPIVAATQTAPLKIPDPGWAGEVQVTLIRIK